MTRKIRSLLEPWESVTRDIKAMQDSLGNGDYVQSLARCEQILRRDRLCVPALIAVASIIQLSDDEYPPDLELDDARVALETASMVESLGGASDHELGRFLFAVADESGPALAVIDRGIERRERELLELTVARIEVLVDLGREDEAAVELDRAKVRFPNSHDLLTALRLGHS